MIIYSLSQLKLIVASEEFVYHDTWADYAERVKAAMNTQNIENKIETKTWKK